MVEKKESYTIHEMIKKDFSDDKIDVLSYKVNYLKKKGYDVSLYEKILKGNLGEKK